MILLGSQQTPSLSLHWSLSSFSLECRMMVTSPRPACPPMMRYILPPLYSAAPAATLHSARLPGAGFVVDNASCNTATAGCSLCIIRMTSSAFPWCPSFCLPEWLFFLLNQWNIPLWVGAFVSTSHVTVLCYCGIITESVTIDTLECLHMPCIISLLGSQQTPSLSLHWSLSSSSLEFRMMLSLWDGIFGNFVHIFLLTRG